MAQHHQRVKPEISGFFYQSLGITAALGVGDDGHTASWPPGNRGVAASTRWVEVVPEFLGVPRMTVTARVVNSARWRMVLALGGEKSAVIRRWVEGDDSLPVTMVEPTDTYVFLDAGAASGLQQ